jgi:hypothetical protein
MASPLVGWWRSPVHKPVARHVAMRYCYPQRNVVGVKEYVRSVEMVISWLFYLYGDERIEEVMKVEQELNVVKGLLEFGEMRGCCKEKEIGGS